MNTYPALPLLSLLFAASITACTAETETPSEPAVAAESELSLSSIAGEYRATADRASFDRHDSNLRWAYYELSIVDLGGGQCSYSARTAGMDCGAPCDRADIDDPANQRGHEGSCNLANGGRVLELHGTSGANFDHVDLRFDVKRNNGRLEIKAQHDHVKQTFDKVGTTKARVRDFATNASVAYSRQGKDNNYVSLFELSPGDNQMPRPSSTQKALWSKNDIQASLAKCVFITNGAYGDHISKAQASAFAGKLAGQIASVRTPSMKFFEIGNASNTGDIITSGCVFRMEEGGYRLELDGASFD